MFSLPFFFFIATVFGVGMVLTLMMSFADFAYLHTYLASLLYERCDFATIFYYYTFMASFCKFQFKRKNEDKLGVDCRDARSVYF